MTAAKARGSAAPARQPGAARQPGFPYRPRRHPRVSRSRGQREGGERQRRADPWRAAFFVLVVVAIVAGVAWALLGSSLLVVRSVRVAGTHLVRPARVLGAADILQGTPLIRVNPAAVARRVERITQVQSARVSRHWPDAVVITVIERRPALAAARSGRYALIDRFGVVVRWARRRPRGMPILADAGAIAASRGDPGSGSSPAGFAVLRGSPAVRAAATILAGLPARVRRAVVAVSAPSATAVTLRERGGVTILWGGTDRPAAKAAELAILLRTRASFYDVSDPDTVVTRG